MNARQKVKKYKKLAQEYKDKAVMFDNMQRAFYFERLRWKRGIVDCKLKIRVPFFHGKENTPTAYKRELAREMADYLLNNNLLWIEYERNPVEQAYIYTASLKVVK